MPPPCRLPPDRQARRITLASCPQPKRRHSERSEEPLFAFLRKHPERSFGPIRLALRMTTQCENDAQAAASLLRLRGVSNKRNTPTQNAEILRGRLVGSAQDDNRPRGSHVVTPHRAPSAAADAR